MTSAVATLRVPVVVLIGASLIGLITYGVRADFGLLLTPVSSTMGWGREVFALSFAIQNLVWGLSQPFFGAIADKFGSGRILVAGGVLYAGGLALMTVSAAPAAMHLNAGIVIGIALACSSTGIVLAAVARHMPEEKRSWALGIVTAASSMGQFTMVPLGQAFIEAYGWKTAVLLLAVCVALVVPLARTLTGRSEGAASGPEQTLRVALSKAGGHASYWYLLIGFFVCGFQISFIGAHLPAYITDLGLPVSIGAWALSMVGLFNVVGSYGAGVLGGKFSKKYLLSALYVSRSAVVTVFVLVPPSTTSVLVFAALMGILWLATMPLTSGLVAQMFGVKYLATLFGMIFLSHQLGAFIGVWLGGYLYDTTGSYDMLWWMSVALGIIAALLHWPIDESPVSHTAPADTR